MLGKLALVFSVVLIGAAYIIQVVDELDEPLKYASLASVSSNEQLIKKLLAWEVSADHHQNLKVKQKGKYLDVFGKKVFSLDLNSSCIT